jgi:hypothetical protein
LPATENAILRTELGWAAVSGGIVTIIMLAIIYAGVVHHINPPSNIETVDPKTLHLTGEFTEGNLGTTVSPMPLMPATSGIADRAGGSTEDEVKASLVMMLATQGWSTEVAWGKARGVDIAASKDGQRWLIECKGSGSLAPMQNNYFVGVIGEIVQRMADPEAKHSIAFPDLAKFRRLWSELPKHVKQTLKVTALFVASDGTVRKLNE